jgi:hypothetical protein
MGYQVGYEHRRKSKLWPSSFRFHRSS